MNLAPDHDQETALSALEELFDAGDYQAIAWNLVHLNRLRTELTILYRAVEDALVAIMPERELEVDGLPRLERKHGVDRKAWDWDALLSEVRRPIVCDPETGELRSEDVRDAVDRLLDEIRAVAPLTPSSGARAKALRDRGLDPDEFCTAVAGRDTVRIHEVTL